MPITLIYQNIRIDGTMSVSVSDITEDPDSGGFVRRIDFYQDPTNTVNRVPSLTVMIYGDQTSLKLTIPTGVTF